MPLLLPIKRELIAGDHAIVSSTRLGKNIVRVYLVEIVELAPDGYYEVKPDFFECWLDVASYSGYHFCQHNSYSAFFNFTSPGICLFGKVSGSLCYADPHEGFKFLRRIVKKYREYLLGFLCPF